jgi:Ca2+-binding RTX toxin-like protein
VDVLYVHQNFPAQFGHFAGYLIREHGWRCTFVSQTDPGTVAGIRKVRYEPAGGATRQTHYFSRTFKNAIAHAHGVYQALKPMRETARPDLVVGPSVKAATTASSSGANTNLSFQTGPGGTTLVGGGGNELIVSVESAALSGGGAGNRIDGSGFDGRLIVSAAAGPDTVIGAAFRDHLNGGPGNDRITGKAGRHNLLGQAGADRLFARDGTRDTVSGGAGRDSATVDPGDVVRGVEQRP